MSNSTSSCGLAGDEYCGFLYGIVGSLVFILCYSCTRGCTVRGTEREIEHNQCLNNLGMLPQEIVENANEYDSACAICIENFVEGDFICKLPCGHYYHPGCINQWLTQQNVCPLCKETVTNDLIA